MQNKDCIYCNTSFSSTWSCLEIKPLWQTIPNVTCYEKGVVTVLESAWKKMRSQGKATECCMLYSMYNQCMNMIGHRWLEYGKRKLFKPKLQLFQLKWTNCKSNLIIQNSNYLFKLFQMWLVIKGSYCVWKGNGLRWHCYVLGL